MVWRERARSLSSVLGMMEHKGYACKVNDPRVFNEDYALYDTWQDMPGQGVCGLVFEK